MPIKRKTFFLHTSRWHTENIKVPGTWKLLTEVRNRTSRDETRKSPIQSARRHAGCNKVQFFLNYIQKNMNYPPSIDNGNYLVKTLSWSSCFHSSRVILSGFITDIIVFNHIKSLAELEAITMVRGITTNRQLYQVQEVMSLFPLVHRVMMIWISW